MNKEQQIEEFQNDIIDNLFNGGTYGLAEALYNAGYRKIDEFAECRNCTAWSGTDCIRHPYTQGCLKEENNIKRQAVKEFAERLKKDPRINNYGLEFVALVDIDAELKSLLKEYEK